MSTLVRPAAGGTLPCCLNDETVQRVRTSCRKMEMSWIDWMNQNSGFMLVLLTAAYVFCTGLLYRSAKQSNNHAKQLYEADNRPVVICDFFSENTSLYFRIKNFGRASAIDIKLAAQGPAPELLDDWMDNSAVGNGITCLAPSAERVFFFCGPRRKDLLTTVEFTVQYTDANRRRQFKDQYKHNLRAWLHEDLGRQNNSPLIQELKNINAALALLGKDTGIQ